MYKTILKYFMAYKLLGVAFLLGLLFEFGYQIFAPLSFKYIIDEALIPKDGKVFVLIIGILLGGGIISVLAGIGSDYAISKLSGNVLLDMRMKLFVHIQKMPINFFNRFRVGDLVARFSDDMKSTENVISYVLPIFLKSSLSIVIGVGILFTLNWKLTIAMMLGSILFFLGPRLLKNKAYTYTSMYKSEMEKLANDMDEFIKGQKFIRSYHLHEKMYQRFLQQMMRMYNIGFKGNFVNSNLERLPMTALLIFNAIILSYGGYLTFQEEISIGTFIGYNSVFIAVGNAIFNITIFVPILINSSVSFNRIDEVLSEKVSERLEQQTEILPSISKGIYFENVSFGYTDEQLALKQINMKIPVGKFVAFVGPSGSGKSTMAQLLLRFYDPQGGFIKFDHTNISTITSDSFYEKLGTVLQDTYLFNTTIRENLLIVNSNATEEDMIKATKAAEIHETIEEMKDGYETKIINEGGNLSGGQRQRISLARAILKDSQVLVLDEATSALDPATEAAVNDTIYRIAKGRTIISITHRLSSIGHADEIFVFDKGQVVEHGTHEELINNNALYKKMWDKQSGFSISADGSQVKIDIERLSKLPFFTGVKQNVLKEIADLFVTEHYEKGREIVREGERGDKFYLIVRGKVEIMRKQEDGMDVHLAILQDGDHFGEIALLKKIPRTASVISQTPCVCLSINRALFHQLMMRFPKMKESVEQSLVERT